eukprot:m.103181 g.103181  ORF g.103181 m.103181 type:complete len:166 (+) comp13231_c0_seq2:152-649(+)
MTTQTSQPRLLVLYGPAGAGKSTLADQLKRGSRVRSWLRISQDELGSRQRCIDAAHEALSQGKSVIIDRTNLTESQRVPWIELAIEHGIQPEAVVLLTSDDECLRRAVQRQYHEGGVVGHDAKRIVGFHVRDPHRSQPSRVEGFCKLHPYRGSQEELERIQSYSP